MSSCWDASFTFISDVQGKTTYPAGFGPISQVNLFLHLTITGLKTISSFRVKAALSSSQRLSWPHKPECFNLAQLILGAIQQNGTVSKSAILVCVCGPAIPQAGEKCEAELMQCLWTVGGPQDIPSPSPWGADFLFFLLPLPPSFFFFFNFSWCCF